jgi:hypothetical protein
MGNLKPKDLNNDSLSNFSGVIPTEAGNRYSNSFVIL